MFERPFGHSEGLFMSKVIAVLACVLLSLTCLAEEKEGLNPNAAYSAYARLHEGLYDPAQPKWAPAMAKLAAEGDAFSVFFLEGLETKDWKTTDVTVLKDTVAAIKTRLAKDDDKNLNTRVQMLLERAAFADLLCYSIEHRIVPWTSQLIIKNLAQPGVKAEVEKIKTAYTPADKDDIATQERVRQYAEEILKSQPAKSK